MDICCSQGHYLSNNTASKVQIQKTTAKDCSCLKEPKTKDPKSVPLYDNTTESAKKENNADKNALKNQKKSQSLMTILSTLLRKRKSVISIKSYVSTVIRKATMPIIIPSQKTSICLGNLCAGN